MVVEPWSAHVVLSTFVRHPTRFSHLVFIFPAFSFSTAIAAATRSWNTLSNSPVYERRAAGSSKHVKLYCEVTESA